MIRIFYVYMKTFIIWFSHSIRLAKSGRQFVFKILHYVIRLIRYDNLTRFLYHVCLTGKFDENDYNMCSEHRGALRTQLNI